MTDPAPKKSILDQINEGLNRLFNIRTEHANYDGYCQADGQKFPCITIQAMNAGPDMVSKTSKGAEFRAKQAKKGNKK